MMGNDATVFEDIRRQASIERKKEKLTLYTIKGVGVCILCRDKIPRGSKAVSMGDTKSKLCSECVYALHALFEEERRKS